ncbi:type IV secretion protein Rhs [Occultella glacieicola]|uniref:Type IV secretion protein Rhs n=1 Tax=Occultella glacieicola TaxID=2518684 RepID=A0ABY2E8F2_9MICO|nr:VgrG-related protein [Occultella glacieicola]TDE98780.1 type IV secretion protein Rhs [Occultella glacieicola]
MPATETFTSSLIVTVDGAALAPTLAANLVSGTIEDTIQLPSMFTLRFADPHAELIETAQLKIGAKVDLRVQTSSTGGPEELFIGEVTALEAELGPTGMFAIVRGMDPSHKLQHGTRIKAYLNKGPGDIVGEIAAAHGLGKGTVDVQQPIYTHLTQDGISDWDFLGRLGNRVGARPNVRDGKLHFRAATDSSTAPAAGSRADPLVIERGVDLEWVRATVTAADQVPDVEVRGWDPDGKRELVATAPAKTVVAAPAGPSTPAKLAAGVGAPTYVVSRSSLSTQAECDGEAKALAERLAGGFAEVEGGGYGNAALRAGVAVLLAGVGTTFEGAYTLTHVRHEFSDEGFRTSFTASGASERTLYGSTRGGESAPVRAGVVPAIVTNLKDTAQAGRVKVKYPTYSGDYESGWARPVQVGAGGQRGTMVLPEVGDEVLVAFAEGEFGTPYVLGGLYNGKDKPDKALSEHVGSDGKVTRRSFTSRTGMLVEFLEKPGGESLVVSTNGGQQRITLTQKPEAAIEIVTTGPVTVKSQQDVTVEAQRNISVKSVGGDIAMEAMNIKLKAQAGFEAGGATVKVAGQASTEVTGANVKVAANAAAELSSGAMTTIRGALVKIN